MKKLTLITLLLTLTSSGHMLYGNNADSTLQLQNSSLVYSLQLMEETSEAPIISIQLPKDLVVKEKKNKETHFYGIEYSLLGKFIDKEKQKEVKKELNFMSPAQLQNQVYTSGIKVSNLFLETRFGPGLYHLDKYSAASNVRLAAGIKIALS